MGALCEGSECDGDEHDCGCEHADGEQFSTGIRFGHSEAGAEHPHEDDAEQAAGAVEDIGEGGPADFYDAVGDENDLRAKDEREGGYGSEEGAFCRGWQRLEVTDERE